MSAIALVLAGCGGGGGGSASSGGSTGGTTMPTPTPTPTPTPATCSLRDRQDWAAAQLREWYLFPETLPASLDPTPYATVDAYIDALTATARNQGKDRFFTYLTSIAEENAFNNAGTSAGFGIRLSYQGSRVFVSEVFEGAPALAAGIDRGAEIVAVGTSSSDMQTTASLIAAGGNSNFSDALGPSTAGVTRILRVVRGGATSDIGVTKASYSLSPVSSRYGAQVIDDGGRKVGYLNLRTFITPANDQLRTAFATFRAQGVTNIIVDLRYNGGGLIATADLLGRLLGGQRATSEVFAFTTYRSEKASSNTTTFFAPQSQSVSPVKIAVIGTGVTASASELILNAMIPYLHANIALVGANTFGKPVGQIPLDRSACDDRLRVVAFALQNANRQGDYYQGMASKVEASCAASDDVSQPMGAIGEASTKAALDYLGGRSCAAISSDGQRALALGAGTREPLMPTRPNAAQQQVPGLY